MLSKQSQAGLKVNNFNVKELSDALTRATTDQFVLPIFQGGHNWLNDISEL